MRVLVACEESQTVCKAFRERGHEAYSADIQKCSGGHPEWHILGDVLPIINGRCEFKTMDGKTHVIDGKWDLMIAHPPCTYLTVSGNRWFNEERYGDKAKERKKERKKAVEFFKKFDMADCDRIAIENPIGYMSTHYKKESQIVQPYFFGDPVRKATCLWLKNLPCLTPTNMVEPQLIHNNGTSYSGAAWAAKDDRGKTIAWNDPRTKVIRSKTFPGLAEAMADQWSNCNSGIQRSLFDEL